MATFWQIISLWYWVILPFFFVPLTIKAWLWWRHEEWQKKQNYVLIELVPPKESMLPPQAMEQVFSLIWAVHTSLGGVKHLEKKWFSGERQSSLSLEIVSMGDVPHMLIRCLEDHLDPIEAAIYSQFPEIEIVKVKDYTRMIPLVIPNKTWDLYGADFTLLKPDPYPIKTYSNFFEQRPESIKEEKRIDPITHLLEAFSKLKDGENLWLQIRIQPTTDAESGFVTAGKELVNKLTHRSEGGSISSGGKKGSVLGDVVRDVGDVATNLPTAAVIPPTFADRDEDAEKSKKENFVPVEMKLTGGEKEIVSAIEEKTGKKAFKTNIRAMYIARRDVFNKSHRTLAEQYLAGFNTEDMNGFKRMSKTRTKTYYYHVVRGRSDAYKKKRMLRRYILRGTPFYPHEGGTFILNTEELATLFHIPIRVGSAGTFLPRIESRKGEPPASLHTQKTVQTLDRDEPTTEEAGDYRGSGGSRRGEPPSNLPI